MLATRTGLALAAAGALVCAAPSASTAATVQTLDSGAIYFQAGAGEDNHLTVTEAGGGFLLEEQSVTIVNTDGPDCDQMTVSKVVCFGANLSDALLDLGDGVNYARLDAPLDGVIEGLYAIQNEFHGGPQDDTLIGGDSSDWLLGGPGVDKIRGNGGDDAVDDGEGDDTVEAGEGGDFIEGAPGADDVDGGPGDDAMDYSDRTERVIVSLDDQANDGTKFIVSEDDNVRSSVERVEGGSGDDHLTGSDAANRLTGGAGHDTLLGRGGDDFLTGFGGDDRSEGGAGDDTLRSEGGADTLIGDDGSDTVTYGFHSLPVEADLDGAANDDGAVGESDTIAADVENLSGGLSADTLIGNAGPNRIDGERGNDVVDGEAGADTLLGFSGDDTLRSQDGEVDSVDCGDGEDFAVSDATDSKAACELPVPLSQAPEAQPPAEEPAPVEPTPPPQPVAVVGISPRRVRLDRRGYATLALRCTGAPCAGRVELRRGGRGHGGRRFALAAGSSTKLRVKVGRALRTALGPKGLKVGVVAGGVKRNVVLLRAKRGGAR